MARTKRVFVCRACGAESPAWTGHCTGCRQWATVEERVGSTPHRTAADPVPLVELDGTRAVPIPTGLDEVDRVLGGGLVPGSVTLLGGEPGIGKSTLCLQMASSVASGGGSVVLVAGEEAPSQVAARARRLGAIPDSLSVVDHTSVDTLEATLGAHRPQLVIVDSIQTLRVADLDAAPGSVPQVKAATHRLAAPAKGLDVSIVLIGHVTKDGSLAGPRLLEHAVDTVLAFCGQRSDELRYLRADKHRYGPTTDVGVFEMTSSGLVAVADPSDRFLVDRTPGAPGSIVVPTLDRHRPVLAELQALTIPNGGRHTGLTAERVSSGRLRVVTAVLEQRAGLPLAGFDVLASAAGGGAVAEPGGDLGLALAVVSAHTGQGLAPDLVACGEIGLGGELRTVPAMDRRLQEAHRLGFRRAVVPLSSPAGPTGLTLVRASCVTTAAAAAQLVPAR